MKKILNSAAGDIRTLKMAISSGCCDSLISEYRGRINGKLQAASILTGNEYTWDGDGIYENHSNRPIVKA